MKTIICTVLALFIAPSIYALESGNYECLKGNNDSICPQIVRSVVKDAKLVGLRIYYSGYCNDQGPYHYDCADGVCSDGTIRFSEMTDTSYRWENVPYGIFCEEFRLKP